MFVDIFSKHSYLHAFFYSIEMVLRTLGAFSLPDPRVRDVFLHAFLFQGNGVDLNLCGDPFVLFHL